MFTQDQINTAIEKIENMNQEQMATLQRFAPAGSIYFRTSLTTVRKAWEARIKVVGGMTPAISKRIGLG